MRRPATQKSNTEFTSSLRANFNAAQRAVADNKGPSANGDTQRPDYTSWTSKEDGSLFIPSIDFTNSGLVEERSQYEITVKLFFLPNQPATCRCAQTREAVELVLKELHVSSIDLLIISYPGILFDADDDDDGEDDDVDSTKETDPNAEVRPEDVDAMIKTWEFLEELHDKGIIARLGVSEFGADRLSRFLGKARVRPSVNQINVRDCCVVPKPLILYAKQEKIELLTHNDCTNILPRGTLREMLGSGDAGVGVLADGQSNIGLKGEVTPQWVIKYTAVIADRGVIENKGYFALAALQEA